MNHQLLYTGPSGPNTGDRLAYCLCGWTKPDPEQSTNQAFLQHLKTV